MSDSITGSTEAKEKSTPSVAVALEYNPVMDVAPRIIASGKGAVADQILNLAFANGIKVRQDQELVQILSMLEIDSVIPLDAFAVVAEILAYVYKSNALASQRNAE